VGLNESRITSKYHGISFQLQRRYSRGFAFQTAYTYGVAKDYAGSAMIVERPDLDYGYAAFDIRHKVAMNAVWEIPFTSSSPVVNGILGGWQLNAIAIMQSGAPFTVTCGFAYPRCDFNADGVNNDRVHMPSFGTDFGDPSLEEWVAGVFTADDFPVPAQGEIPNGTRNAFRGPGFKNLDLSLFKNFNFPGFTARGSTVQVRVEVFNAFNWVNLNNPVSNTNSANFGRVQSARTGTGGPRTVQFGVKYLF
jgi:hypothetical protein